MAPSLCELCGLSRLMFSNRLQYSERFKKHKNQKVSCPECEKHCYSKYQLSNHMRYAHGSVFTCDQCSKAFGTKGNLTRHVNNNHKTDCNMACDKCNKIMRQDNYRKHYVTCLKEAYKSTNKKFKCSICQESFIFIFFLPFGGKFLNFCKTKLKKSQLNFPLNLKGKKCNL